MGANGIFMRFSCGVMGCILILLGSFIEFYYCNTSILMI